MVSVAAYSEILETITLPAGSALSGAQYKFVAISASGNVNLVAASGGLRADGVLYNKPKSGNAATIVVGGVAKVVSAGVIAAGGLVASDSGGAALAAVSGATQAALGRALVASTGAGSVISVLLNLVQTYVTG